MAATVSNFLVVDDDPIFQAVAESVLLSLGADMVACAGDGDEGLERVRNAGRPIDMVILDLNMPGLDGLGFLRAIADEGFAGEIVISSGEAAAIINAAGHLAQRLGIRIAGTLKKPITQQAVSELLAAERPGPATASRQGLGIDSDSLAAGGIIPYYQPQYDLVTDRPIGVEALARFRASDGRTLGPSFIFDQITSHGELMDVTGRIIHAALRDLQHWRAIGIGTRLSLNMDTRVLEDPAVWAMLTRSMEECEISPEAIVLEMTETALPSNMSVLIEVLTRLRMKGYGVSMDDFGTGGANFDLLRVCPFSEVKIDQSIVQSADIESHSRRFIEFCVKTARDLGVELMAEGIETQPQRDLLISMGVTHGQGYLMSRPMPAHTIQGILGDHQDTRPIVQL